MLLHWYWQILQTTTSDQETFPSVQDGQLDHNVGRMRYQTMDLLIKMSRLLQHKKLGTTFLVVNFHHVCLVPYFTRSTAPCSAARIAACFGSDVSGSNASALCLARQSL